MEDNEKKSTTRTVAKNVNDAIVFGAIAFSAFKVAKLGYDGAREGVRFLKSRRNKTEN
jgi:hypothetical protein